MPTLEVKCFDTLIVIFNPYELFLCLSNLKRLDDGENSLLDLDEIVAKYKVEYDRTSKMDLAKNITLNRKGLKSQLVSYLIGQDGSYNSDWKRLARNIELDNVEIDIDAMIWHIDCNNEKVNDKCYRMLQELEKIKREELSWAVLNSALQRIDRTDCANDLEEWFSSIGKTVKIL